VPTGVQSVVALSLQTPGTGPARGQATTALAALGAHQHLSVSLQNNSPVPARHVTARLLVYQAHVSGPSSATIR
jgi:hypothetical protein